MRAAAPRLAFAGFGAQYAICEAFTDTVAWLGVSRNLCYDDDGIARQASRGQAATIQWLRIDLAAVQATDTLAVTIHELEPRLPMFGLTARQDDAR